jgi:hypothetical protein
MEDEDVSAFVEKIWFEPSELTDESEEGVWKQKIAAFESRVSLSMHSAQLQSSTLISDVSSERLRKWTSEFRRSDPRYRILEFFTDVSQLGADAIEEKGIDLLQIRPLLRFLFRASVFTVWRPTSYDAIKKMMLGQAVGKGLDIKGKSAKRGKLSAFVPFLQIGENRHKNLIRTLPKKGTLRLFFKKDSRRGRCIAAGKLEAVGEEMAETVRQARLTLADKSTDDESREDAMERYET